MSKPFSKVLWIGFGLLAFATGALLYVAQQQHTKLAALSSAVRAGAHAPTDAPSVDGLKQQVAWLERRVMRLERDAQRAREAFAEPPARARSGSEGARLVGSSSRAKRVAEPVQRATESAVMDLLESEDPVIQERIGEVVRRERERAFEERQTQMLVRMSERSRERVAMVAEEVALSVAQVEWINTALEEERERIFDLFAAARQEGEFREVGEEVRKLREETDQNAARELDADQLEAFREMREEERSPWGGRGRRPRPPPPSLSP